MWFSLVVKFSFFETCCSNFESLKCWMHFESRSVQFESQKIFSNLAIFSTGKSSTSCGLGGGNYFLVGMVMNPILLMEGYQPSPPSPVDMENMTPIFP